MFLELFVKALPKTGIFGRVLQIFDGKDGIWITLKGGKKIFLEASRVAQGVEKKLKTGVVLDTIDFSKLAKVPPGIESKKLLNIQGVGPALFKTDPATAFREAAAYDVAKVLGLDMIPPTVLRQSVLRNLDSGSLQAWIPSKASYHYNVDVMKKLLTDNDITKAGAFDFLILNKDRHAANWRHSLNGKLILIDHGFTFGGTKTSSDIFISGGASNNKMYSILTHLATDRNLRLGSLSSWLNKSDDSFEPVIDSLLTRRNFNSEFAEAFYERYALLSEGIRQNWTFKQLLQVSGIQNKLGKDTVLDLLGKLSWESYPHSR